MARPDQHPARRVLASNVRRLRIAKNLSQHELAAEAKIRQALVSAIEVEAANPTLDSLGKLADALKVNLDALFEDTRTRK
jgi:transcriptional regulator with XRE-family HTH domain